MNSAQFHHSKRFIVAVSGIYHAKTKKSFEKAEFGEELIFSYFCCNNVSISGHEKSLFTSAEGQYNEIN